MAAGWELRDQSHKTGLSGSEVSQDDLGALWPDTVVHLSEEIVLSG